MSGKVIKIARLVIRGDTGIEAPGEDMRVIQGKESVFQRFPRAPGREPKNTPYEMAYDHATGLVTITHPRSRASIQVPREHCYWYPFSAVDEAMESAELEKATRPEPKAAVA